MPTAQLTIFGRQPLAIISAIQLLLAAVVVWLVPSDRATEGLFSPDGQAAIIVALTALAAVATAFMTRPIAPTVFSGFIQAAFAVGLYAGLDFTPEKVLVFQMAVVGVMGLIGRQQITPVADPRPLVELKT